MEQFKTGTILLASANASTNLHLLSGENYIDKLIFSAGEHAIKSQYLYILSDDKIEVGDWMFDLKTEYTERCNSNNYTEEYGWKKIIATTNRKIKVPKIQDEFIKDYCILFNNPEIYDIKAEYVFIESLSCDEDGPCKFFELKLKILPIRKAKVIYTKEEVIALCTAARDHGMLKEDILWDEWIEENIK